MTGRSYSVGNDHVLSLAGSTHVALGGLWASLQQMSLLHTHNHNHHTHNHHTHNHHNHNHILHQYLVVVVLKV